MPALSRTSLEDIVRAARDLLEADGAGGLSMQAVAARVGVRAPSLYKHVRDRDDLVRLVAEATLAELRDRLDVVLAAGSGRDAVGRLSELARAFRAFAHERPAGYRLIFAPASASSGPAPESLARAVTPMLNLAAELAGPDDALAAARTVTAWANGFIGMELAGSFRLGGDVDSAFEYGITRLAAALAH